VKRKERERERERGRVRGRERECACCRMEGLYLTGLSQSSRSFTIEDFIHLVCFISGLRKKSIQFYSVKID